MTKNELHEMFTYHPPKGDQPERYQKIRSAAEQFALVILENTPACADQTVAIRKIRESVMVANASIAINE